LSFAGKLGGRRPPLQPDPELIRRLAELLAETGLSEIEYSIGDHRIRVARGNPGIPETASAPALPGAANGHGREIAETGGGTHSPTPAAEHPGTVKAPLVGIAYLAAEPGAAPLVQVGDQVASGQPLLIIEAMKVMNQIRAPRAGRVARILIADAEPVEYGAPLMLIE